MSSTTTKQSDTLQIQSSANVNPNSASKSELIDKEKNTELNKQIPIDGTPFIAVWTEEKEWFGTYKRYQITGHHKTQEELIEAINYNTWHIISLLISIMIVEADNIKDQLNAANKKEQ